MGIEFSPEFEGAEALSKFNDVESLGRSYLELQSKLGKSVELPEDAEGKAALFEKLGAPAAPDEYEIPEGTDPGMAEKLRVYAHQAKLTPEQFASVAAGLSTESTQAQEAAQQAAQGELEALVESYGDDLPAAKARVLRALSELPEAEAEALDINDPKVFRLLDRMGQAVPSGNSGVAPTGTVEVKMAFNPEEVALEARRIMESEAYSDRRHPEHNLAVNEYTARLQQLMAKGFQGAFDPRLQASNPFDFRAP